MKDWNHLFGMLSEEELDKLAILRVIECTNGVIQHMFRDEDPEALSVEDTRIAMKFSMSCMKNVKIPLGDTEITFSKETTELIKELRALYISGVKNSDENDYNEFLIASRANITAIGIHRIMKAKKQICYHIYDLPPHTLDWGVEYITNFIK